MSPAEAAIREALAEQYDDMQWAYSNEDPRAITMHERGWERGRESFVSASPALLSELDALRDVLRRNGFVPCDISACNCGSWHARYGLPERMDEIKQALADAGHPLSNENGNLTLNALTQLVVERDALLKGAGRE